MRLLLSLCVLTFCGSSFAATERAAVYPAHQYSCGQLNSVLDASGHIRVSKGAKIFDAYAWDARPQCISASGADTKWIEFNIKAANGYCELGYLCVEKHPAPDINTGKPPCHAIGCDYPGKPDNEG